MQPIAHIENAFATKFGVPRQSGIVAIESRIVFEPAYRIGEALRGIEDFEYLWLIWQFSEAIRKDWSPTVRPPRLGGNQRMGVFATRSPFRPNNLGLSSVRLLRIEDTHDMGKTLIVEGADMMHGTPIFDIKPYLPYTDCHPNARSGFAQGASSHLLDVSCTDEMLQRIDKTLQQTLIEVLAHDPRPQYQDDPNRVYGLVFGGCEIHFTVNGNRLTVRDIEKTNTQK